MREKLINIEKDEFLMEPDIVFEECDCFFDEKHILEEVDADFYEEIKKRGKDYYEKRYIISCFKSGNEYHAKVAGSDDNVYDVNVIIDDWGIDFYCTCPCDFPCKHEYACLIAISKKEYKTINLKPENLEKNIKINDILKQIPAEEVKSYLLSLIENKKITLDKELFEEQFIKYLPKQDYEYYYNKLYNSLVLDNNYIDLVNSYFAKINRYISAKEFNECFKIIKSIIESYKDSDRLNDNNYIISIFPNLGMYLRIIYRKVDEKGKNDIDNWILKLDSANYYDNCYLEDIILSIN